VLALREPSLGPVFGVKGGAAGGGYSQVLPMEEINLHFTGDFHAIASAHNLLSALIDNHLTQGNALGLDARRISWPRTIDMNDRVLRDAVIGLGGAANGVPREERWVIVPASEVMAIVALASDYADLQARLARIVVGTTGGTSRLPITAGDLGADQAMSILLKHAMRPNLVQTLEGGPAIVHAGPFGNIAHGCNSLVATRAALALGDVVVTEAGFGSDLGAEKFFDIVCRTGELNPEAAVRVATRPIREQIETIAQKVYGADGVDFSPAAERNMTWLEANGMADTPVCMAKTQYSLTDDATRLGRPVGFRLTVSDVSGSAGAGFVVARCGDIMTMPGLSPSPAAVRMTMDAEGRVSGLS
jgi:formyltetrahydrofolate synthetase